MAKGYIVRRPHFVRGVHISPENQHLVPSLLSAEEIEERVKNGALEVSDTPDESPEETTEASSRRRRGQAPE